MSQEKQDKSISIILTKSFILWIYRDMAIVKCQSKNKIKFGKFIEEYLFSRENISLIILLLDIRHKPTENDRLMYEYIKNTGRPYLIVANKADKIAVTKVNEAVEEIRKELEMSEDERIIPFSSERKIYVEETWNNIGVEI